jgi:hypothetical protein
MSPGWVPSLDAKKNGSQIGLDLAQILKHVVDFPAADRREFAGLNGQTLLSEPMIIYGFCKPRTESLEKTGYTSELVGRVAPEQGLLRKS